VDDDPGEPPCTGQAAGPGPDAAATRMLASRSPVPAGHPVAHDTYLQFEPVCYMYRPLGGASRPTTSEIE
jgi:hypothetical protein